MKFNLFISYFTCIALILNSFAQDKGNTIELKTILQEIEKEETVTFNYLEEDIALFKYIPPSKKLDLNDKLNYLASLSNLNFHFITKNYISISSNPNTKICGYLFDSETKDKITNATVHFQNTNIFSISDDNGYFEIVFKSNNPIEVNHLSYYKKFLDYKKIKPNHCIEWFLEPQSSQLKEVITPVYLTKGISKKRDGSFEIQSQKFSILPGLTEPDVFQTMQQLTGINSADQTISNTNVRGGSHDQNLFLWNGIRLFQTGHFFGLISVLNPNLPNKIKIIKNGTSAFYGESVSSTIAISTENNFTNYDSFGLNLINFDFNKKIKTGKNGLLTISARRSYTNFLETPTYNDYYKRIFQNTIVTSISDNQDVSFNSDVAFYFFDTSLQLDQKINDKNTIQINLLTISNQLDVNQSKIENDTTVEKNSSLDQESFGGSFLFQRDWNKNNTSQFTLYASNYNVHSTNESINSNQILFQKNSIFDTGIRLENKHHIDSSFIFKNGYQFNEIGIRNIDEVNTPSFFRNNKKVLNSHALITEIDYITKNKKTGINLGIRNNYISELRTYLFEPRLHYNYQINPFFSFQLLAEKKHQTTTQVIDLQQDFLGIENKRWILADQNNTPIIKSNQISLGFSYKKNNWLLSTDHFYKKVKGINSKSQGFQNQLEFESITGNYNTIGAEILIQKQIQNLTSWISYTICQNNYDFDSFEPKKFPSNFDIQHNISCGLVYNLNLLNIALGSRWFTGKPTTNPLNNTIQDNKIVYNSPNSDRLPNFFQTNISANYTFQIKKTNQLQVGASIQNLFNTTNVINQYFRINQNTNTIEKINTYSLELTPNAYFRYYF
ncbi:TonB-dependent receptor [Flavobacterium sp. 9AF]|uniref:TonB-dependent receptor plug domain-containing protein n=1 Tax=Flavobacterium sp. 9AF TaxID=2653142 RepID=UPI0012F0A827|nr:TonB-dependent receptor plug domain-containing protein [Flavobacterium sp. 9AF]VXB53903.1 TonB-dependent receptor [Flavobacterium sp. 9AF]